MRQVDTGTTWEALFGFQNVELLVVIAAVSMIFSLSGAFFAYGNPSETRRECDCPIVFKITTLNLLDF